MLISVPSKDSTMVVNATGLRAAPVPTRVPTSIGTVTTVDLPMIGAKTSFNTGI